MCHWPGADPISFRHTASHIHSNYRNRFSLTKHRLQLWFWFQSCTVFKKWPKSPLGGNHRIFSGRQWKGKSNSSHMYLISEWKSILIIIVDLRQFHVFARHGKTKNLALWTLQSLSASNSNLNEYVVPQRYDEFSFQLPLGGIAGENGLRNQCVIIDGLRNLDEIRYPLQQIWNNHEFCVFFLIFIHMYLYIDYTIIFKSHVLYPLLFFFFQYFNFQSHSSIVNLHYTHRKHGAEPVNCAQLYWFYLCSSRFSWLWFSVGFFFFNFSFNSCKWSSDG